MSIIIHCHSTLNTLTHRPDSELIGLFATNGSLAIELVFKKYYRDMCLSAIRVVKDQSTAEDIVQEVFYELYRKKETLKIDSLKAYLSRAVFNRSINYVKGRREIVESNDDTVVDRVETYDSQDQMEYNELENYINKIIDTLPEKCRLVFVLSRFEQLSYKEIAQRLDISVKTVENQMSKALKILRQEFVTYKNLEKSSLK